MELYPSSISNIHFLDETASSHSGDRQTLPAHRRVTALSTQNDAVLLPGSRAAILALSEMFGAQFHLRFFACARLLHVLFVWRGRVRFPGQQISLWIRSPAAL